MFVATVTVGTIVVLQTAAFWWYTRRLRARCAFWVGIGQKYVDQIVENSQLRKELEQTREDFRSTLTNWQDMALAFEVFCDCLCEGDLAGSQNAARAINTARENLRQMGEYDD
jgi:hypothetical protein